VTTIPAAARRCSLCSLAIASALACAASEPGASSLRPLPTDRWDRQTAAHLLRRAGFGGTPDEVDRLARLGLDGAVDLLLDHEKIPYEPPPVLVDPLVLEPLDRAELRAMTPEEREHYQERRRRAQRRTLEETRLAWLERMAHSPRPLEERMTLFWHGHFTSGMREVRNGLFMKEQNDFLRRHALDSFRELLLGISKDRAMLTYLDGNRNVKARPNENYGRELLELFTLGVGNYREADIQAAARAFTGWSYNDDGFVFRRREHDFDDKTFLGRSGRWDGDDIIDIILEQPACARFLAAQLLSAFCRPEPDKALIEALAREIRAHRYHLKPVLRTLFRSQAFYHPRSRGRLVKSPVEIVVGTTRLLGVPLRDLPAAERATAAMGQELMQPPSVKGWDGGPSWINTATLFTRYNTASRLIQGDGPPPAGRRRLASLTAAPNDEAPGDPDAQDEARMHGSAAPARSRMRASPQPAHDPLPLLHERGLTSAEQIVEFYGTYLLAVPIEARKRELLVQYLEGAGGFSIESPSAADRVRSFLKLLCSTPEFQMY
jgi:hypothetical protein